MAVIQTKGFSFGPYAVVTIASGVATVPAGVNYVRLAAETSTTDTLDSIVRSGSKAGDVLILEADAGDTITVDDANIDIGGSGSRALADVGQYLTLIYNGAGWSEAAYGAGDNS